ncbi:predicted protein [Nematostella vectensis]|uniref:Uncharacterized protein n=1 Tax=Nematostella vectensis TaxID=45351 RepID=A7SNF0_NEMVE|nr:uncharacterized protein LOC5506152 [Nematostella vectensis]EDO34767.1 predicted protein [Nematostella vectensis]|eukprot:XP_001626867.1 predicted protein [Nematostella vectensis]
MNGETERIIQVSLSKITDCRRRRGTTLRRSLLVSNVLNNVLTSSDSAYDHYRTPKDTDMDYDAVETESFSLDRPVPLRDDSFVSGNVLETRNPSHKASETKVLCERPLMENPQVRSTSPKDIESERSTLNLESNNSTFGKETQANVVCVGSKRLRSQNANETSEYHAVGRKRCRIENSKSDLESVSDAENIEPMDISGLVSVFSSSFSGLSDFSSKKSSGSFACLDAVRPLQLGSWQHTVEAF